MRIRPFLLLMALAVLPAAADRVGAEQNVRSVFPRAELQMRLDEGDRLHARFQPRDALGEYQAVLERDSLHFEALWKAAREAVHVGMMSEEDRQKEWYREAESYARRALRVRPRATEGHHWLSVAVGRRALREGIRTRARLAEEVKASADRVLAVDSLHPGGHHVLGQWHAEIMRLDGFSRFVAENLLGGGAMDEASWEAAERHLVRATELAPDGLVHWLELGRLYADTDRPDRAREALERVLQQSALEPADPVHKQEAQELLRELG